MKFPRIRLHIGMRTVKTVAAVVVSMLIVDAVGMTDSRLIFAMLGATAALQPTFKESLDSCKAQIVGVLFGAFAGLFLRHLPMPMHFNTGLGIALCITLYNALSVRYSPSMPIFMVVLLCTTPDIQAIPYALGRIWDSAVGLGVGMLINTLVFPYDNSRQIQATIESLDRELLRSLEEMFDGDQILPDPARMEQKVADMARQLELFSNQRLFLRRGRQKRQLESFRICQGKARELLARMEILSRMEQPGRLTRENRTRLRSAGAVIGDSRPLKNPKERDIVINYHVAQILKLRKELLEALRD